jgi:exoribonuclease R
MTHKVHIHDRGYTSWTFYNTHNFKEEQLQINPLDHKLLTNDVFTFNQETNAIEIIHSIIRLSGSIAGVIILKNNKTYGRKNGKFLYKCLPDDKRIPAFLVPYEMKNIGFSKVFNNLYVTFHFIEWKDKHPHGIITNTIGPVDVLDNFYEYQLYCKSLNTSIQKFTKDTSKVLKNAPHDAFIENISKKFPNIEDRTTGYNIFTIDPPNSLDFDDGFSIKELSEGNHMMSIYISNVTLWMDILKLWDSFSRRISTIYLPDRKRPMLPTMLSDCLCSLQEKNTRLAFVMDVFIKSEDGKHFDIIDVKYSNCKIRVSKNFRYEEPKLLADRDYNELIRLTNMLSRKYKYINGVENSHELVTYLMILMNYNTAKVLINHNCGIFRSSVIKRHYELPSNLPEDVTKFIKIWNSSAGQYLDVASLKEGQAINHEVLEMDAYIHITSPIRRLVDLLNIIKFQQVTGLIQLSENAGFFYDKWISELEYINTSMRAIRKIQNDCSLLHLCNTDPSLMEKNYIGYAFDKIVRNDLLNQYVVYLPELKIISRVTMRDNINNYQMNNYKLFLFNDEDNFKKKIRLQIMI